MSNEELPENNNEDDSDDNSDDNLKIVIESPLKEESEKSKRKIPPTPSNTEKLIIESIEDELEKRLEEKAAKTKLNSNHVKNIIRHVVTNEHVLALVKKAENPSGCDETIPYEPKLTRAKAKELLSSIPASTIPWSAPKPTSEVQVLFTGDLQEDSSGDEYIPGEEESEDDRDSSIFSDPPSVPPPTPPMVSMNTDSSSQMNWTEDGVFKIPPNKSKEDIEDEANIARRTRSKLCLSSTPLETIEEGFIPPDITTDMYDMDCDNDDWMDFLKKFTRPLDEVAKATEDEEQDPEYNILADEEIDKIDKEELRVDKAVKVTRKELNDLIAELLEYSEVDPNDVTETEKRTKHMNTEEYENSQPEAVNNSEKVKSVDVADSSREKTVISEESITVVEEENDIIIKRSQIPLLEQQMRQHVQMLTQNFILTYQHPELHHYSMQVKEYLLNLKLLCEGKQRSAFYALNLTKALQLVKYWEDLLATNSSPVAEMKRHIEKTMAECIRQHKIGNFYVNSFPQLILETVSKSDVFIYPSLLPKIPFKPRQVFSNRDYYSPSEDQLIALGLEQFDRLLKKDRRNLSKVGEVTLKAICSCIQEYMMPHKDMYKIYAHINFFKYPRCADNPIKYYFQHKKTQPVVHFVEPLHELLVLPPCQRSPCQLPEQWKDFNHTNKNTTPVVSSVSPVNRSTLQIIPITVLNVENSLLLNTPQITPVVLNTARPILIKEAVTSTRRKPFSLKSFKRRRLSRKPEAVPPKVNVDPITKFVECLCRPSAITKLIGLTSDSTKSKSIEKKNTNFKSTGVSKTTHTMLPSMPSLGTPLKNYPQNEVSSCDTTTGNKNDNTASRKITISTKSENRKNILHEISTICSSSFQQVNTSTEVEFCRPDNECQTVTSTCKGESNGTLENCSSSTSDQENLPNSTDQNESIKESISVSSEKVVPDVVHNPTVNVKPPPKKEPSGAEKKRTKLRKEYLANLSITAPADPETERQKNEMFALAYYDKLRETLELEEYHKIMQILNEHEEDDGVDLYRKIEKILSPRYQELAEEFLLFLQEKEAAAAGQLVSWIKINNRSKFLRKVEVYFKEQPAQLRKIYKCLTELSQVVNISMEQIKSTLLPLFKGNAVLSDLFLQNFLSERPPPSLLEASCEIIDVNKELSRPDEEPIYETITLPNTKDKYGGQSCICNCHEIEDPDFKTRYRHCIRCGTRFINGKVFIQSGRGLRPATVSFLNNPDKDHEARLLGKTPTVTGQRKKSPSKPMPSLTKENPDEETEDEVDGKKKSKRKPTKRKPSEKASKSSKGPRKTAVPKKTKSAKAAANKIDNTNATNKEQKASGRKRTYSAKKRKDDKKVVKVVEEKVEVKPGATSGQQKRLAEESMEWEENPDKPSTSSAEVKPNSPDPHTAESESEFCEESSQDNYCESDSNSSISSLNNHSQSDSNAGEECSWTRAEDKIILETFQKENDKEYAFKIIADKLKNRTVSQINSRFQTLMTLLLETLGSS